VTVAAVVPLQPVTIVAGGEVSVNQDLFFVSTQHTSPELVLMAGCDKVPPLSRDRCLCMAFSPVILALPV
jgi:hypothetical protein